MTDNMNDINENEVTPEEVSTEVKNVSGDTVNAAKVMKKKDIGEVTKRQTAMKVAVQVGLCRRCGLRNSGGQTTPTLSRQADLISADCF